MRTRLRSLAVVLTILLVGTSGCQRLEHEGTYPMKMGEIQGIQISAPRGDQKVTVDVSASPAPIDVYVVLEDNRAAVTDKLHGYKEPDAGHILASKKKVDTGTLETTIPAGKAFSVILAGATKKTDVKVKIKGQ
ncbi:MAG TPA: hypothetical protein VEL76_27575 [Gemmataceae bacterium]|nr:hypothetical protein [Gemmataceae bacterium]